MHAIPLTVMFDKIAHKLIEPFGQRALIYPQVTYLSLTNPLPPSIPQQPHHHPTHTLLSSPACSIAFMRKCTSIDIIALLCTYIHIYSLPHTLLPSLIFPLLSSPLHPSYIVLPFPSLLAHLLFPLSSLHSSFLSPTLFTSQVKQITQYATTMSYLTTSHIMQRYLHWQGLPAYRFCSSSFLHS